MVSALCVTDDKAHYYPDSAMFVTKLIADGESHKLLGLQVIGAGAVDKMADIAVTGISFGAKAEDFLTMDFAYAPPLPPESTRRARRTDTAWWTPIPHPPCPARSGSI